jgi:nucleotide-binding universal stress UspA family protein
MDEQTVSGTQNKAVVGVDGSDDSMAALRRAKILGSAMHAELHVVHVRHAPYWWSIGTTASAYAVAQSRQALDELAAEVEAAVKKELSTYEGRWFYQVREGNPADELLAVSDEIEAVAVIVGARGHRPGSPYLLGSVSTALLHRAPISVLIVRGPGPAAPQPTGHA